MAYLNHQKILEAAQSPRQGRVLAIGMEPSLIDIIQKNYEGTHSIERLESLDEATKRPNYDGLHAIVVDLSAPKNQESKSRNIDDAIKTYKKIQKQTDTPIILIADNDLELRERLAAIKPFEVVPNPAGPISLGNTIDNAVNSSHSRLHEATGLYSKEYFMTEVQRAYENAGKQQHRRTKDLRFISNTITVGYYDLDGFKEVNDKLGHHIGDKILSVVGAIFRAMRPGEIAGGMGGDEVTQLIYGDQKSAQLVAQRTCDYIHKFPFESIVGDKGSEEIMSRIRISAGVANTAIEWVHNATDLVAAADTAMQKAKGANKAAENGSKIKIYGYGSGKEPVPLK